MLATVPSEIQDFLKEEDILVSGFKSSSGGCINNGGKLESNKGTYFVKWNDAHKFPGMFEAESKGLDILHKAEAIRIPDPIAVGTADQHSFIIMEFIEHGAPALNFFETMGRQLAVLHSTTNENFGLDHNNYIGSLPQSNSPHSEWSDFFIVQRLDPQIRLAVDKREIPTSFIPTIEKLYSKLENYFPIESPALLHGDLWSGNFIIDEGGQPCLMDPAVYFGHREVDLAFSKLFGGFEVDFYESYNDQFPLEPNFNERVDIYNLYPLLVHVNLFGGSYFRQVRSIVERFT